MGQVLPGRVAAQKSVTSSEFNRGLNNNTTILTICTKSRSPIRRSGIKRFSAMDSDDRVFRLHVVDDGVVTECGAVFIQVRL